MYLSLTHYNDSIDEITCMKGHLIIRDGKELHWDRRQSRVKNNDLEEGFLMGGSK